MSRLPPFFLLLALPLLLMGCAAPPKPTSEQLAIRAFETPEYFAANALPIVKASTLYARGGTGQGVKVALIDSGRMAVICWKQRSTFNCNRQSTPSYNQANH